MKVLCVNSIVIKAAAETSFKMVAEKNVSTAPLNADPLNSYPPIPDRPSPLALVPECKRGVWTTNRLLLREDFGPYLCVRTDRRGESVPRATFVAPTTASSGIFNAHGLAWTVALPAVQVSSLPPPQPEYAVAKKTYKTVYAA